MKKLVSTLALCAVIAAPAAVYAERGGRADFGAEHALLMQERLAEKIGLSEEQRSQIQVLVENHQSVYPKDREARKAQREALQAIVDAETFDESAARNLFEQGIEQKVAQLKLRHDIAQILTAEQKAQLEEIKQRGKKRFKDKRR
ncbi:Spy/CpxP family protein refolding chaperone [Gilvimarinus sp. DA14]|uniref:Spy/CpxP family protein refolding chaperone n=1 Tax=Gilvimarinus sp. DA14 TaxID=2956798 RepID=UPI0020B6ECE3|nr:Spy/CpxP family protein refolding chaperone [Gilvimarinus sp. DA14]UTF60057.1 Spy/CpxP family protein refolding chaperone [Gilvimarinus sp. DA14]